MSAAFTMSYVLLWILVVILLLLVVLLYRQYGLSVIDPLDRVNMSGLDIGSKIPGLGDPALATMAVQAVIDELRESESAVVVFGLASCSVCDELRTSAGGLPPRFPGTQFIWVDDVHPEHVARIPGWSMYESPEMQAHQRFRVPISPFAYFYRDKKVVRKGLVNTVDDVAVMIEPMVRA